MKKALVGILITAIVAASTFGMALAQDDIGQVEIVQEQLEQDDISQVEIAQEQPEQDDIGQVEIAQEQLAQDVSQEAAYADVADVTLYGIDDIYADNISIPDNYPQTYQIMANSGATFSLVSGKSVKVSDTGLVTVEYNVLYWYTSDDIDYSYATPDGSLDDPNCIGVTRDFFEGKSVVRVTEGGATRDITFNVEDYSILYADSVMDDYIANNITDSMTGHEKLRAFAIFAASYEYGTSPSYVAMIILGSGSCMASTRAIIRLCEKVGIEAWERNGNQDGGAGSGHENVMAYVDGKYYLVDAGFVEKAPRRFYCYERTSLFSYKYKDDGIEIYQYDGNITDGKIVIPSTIDDRQVLSIADDTLHNIKYTFSEIVLPEGLISIGATAFTGNGLEIINIPASVTSIGPGALSANISLKSLTVDPNNSRYTSVENVLYSKDMTILEAAPSVTSLEIPGTVTEIAEYAFSFNRVLKSVIIPEGVTKISKGAFNECTALTDIYFKGTQAQWDAITVGDNNPILDRVTVHVNYVPHTHVYTETTVAASCTVDGYYEYTCGCGDSYRVAINAPGHNIVKDPAKEATCTESGLTAGQYCSRCDDATVAQKEIPAKGHNYNGKVTKAATCTEKGVKTYTCTAGDDSYTEDIDALGHRFGDADVIKVATFTEEGIARYRCLNAGCSETDDKPIERLSEKRPDGLANSASYDGNWYYFKDNKVATDVTTVANNSNGWFYVENGKVNFAYTGLAANSYGIWYIKGGKVDFSFKGLYKQDGAIRYLEGGQVKTNKTDVLSGTVLGEGNGESGWWNVVNGTVQYGPTLSHNSNGWWYIDKNGKVDFGYSGLGENANGIFVVKGGKVDFSYKGFYNFGSDVYAYFEGGQFKANKTEVVCGTVAGESGWWNVVKGLLTRGKTVANNSNGWWYIDENGKVDFNYKGLADNAYGTWYCEGGKVQFGKTDVLYCSYNGQGAWWNIGGGQLKKGPTVAQNSNGWWYITNEGKVDFDFTGFGKNANGEWYCKNGKVDFSFNGTVSGKKVQGGKVQ